MMGRELKGTFKELLSVVGKDLRRTKIEGHSMR